MSGKTVEWLTVLIFFGSFFALTYAESAWLSKRGGSPAGKSFAFSFATNIFTVVVGFTLSFAVFAILAMLAFGGAFENLDGNDWRLWAAVIGGVVFPIILSVLAKRLGLRIFKLGAAVSPWAFSFVASIVFLFIVTAAPVLFVYFA